MKKKMILTLATALFLVLNIQAQIPEGFVKGSVTLADGSTITGFVKDNIKKSGALIFVDTNGGNKQLYYSNEVNGAVIDGTNYLSVKSDFFNRFRYK